jgi:transposase
MKRNRAPLGPRMPPVAVAKRTYRSSHWPMDVPADDERRLEDEEIILAVGLRQEQIEDASGPVLPVEGG